MLFPVAVSAQSSLRVKNVGIGYSVVDMSLTGNNPLSIAPLLKDPNTYNSYINGFRYNQLRGNPSVLGVGFFYVTAEIYKPASTSRFWKHYTLEGGITISKRIHEKAGSLTYSEDQLAPEYVHRYQEFSLRRNQRFAALNIALYRKLRISNRVTGLIGLRYQPGLVITNRYEARLDSGVYTVATGLKTWGMRLPDFKAKNYFQAQYFVPLGVDVELIRAKWFLRFQVAFGLLKHRFKDNSLAGSEAHSAGLSILYVPGKRKN